MGNISERGTLAGSTLIGTIRRLALSDPNPVR